MGGGVAALLILLGLLFWFFRARRRTRNGKPAHHPTLSLAEVGGRYDNTIRRVHGEEETPGWGDSTTLPTRPPEVHHANRSDFDAEKGETAMLMHPSDAKTGLVRAAGPGERPFPDNEKNRGISDARAAGGPYGSSGGAVALPTLSHDPGLAREPFVISDTPDASELGTPGLHNVVEY